MKAIRIKRHIKIIDGTSVTSLVCYTEEEAKAVKSQLDAGISIESVSGAFTLATDSIDYKQFDYSAWKYEQDKLSPLANFKIYEGNIDARRTPFSCTPIPLKIIINGTSTYVCFHSETSFMISDDADKIHNIVRRYDYHHSPACPYSVITNILSQIDTEAHTTIHSKEQMEKFGTEWCSFQWDGPMVK